MYTCAQCKLRFDTIQQLSDHIRTLCLVTPISTSFKCGELGCLRNFSTIAALRKHLYKNHTSQSAPNANQSIINSSQFVTNASQSLPLASLLEPVEVITPTPSTSTTSVHPSTDDTQNNLAHHISMFMSSLYANPLISRSAVQVIMELVHTSLAESLESVLRLRLTALFNKTNNDRNCDITAELNQILYIVKNLVGDFQTEHKRLQHFTNLGTYIPPIQIIIGQHMEQKRTRMGLSYVPTECTMQVMPLKLILQKFFSVSDVLKDTLTYKDSLASSTSSVMCNFVQGSVWSEMSCIANNEILLPLILYYDDFEIGNPLGSHAGVHKIGAVYISCPCLPPNYASKLRNIFMFALFHAADRINFGNQIVFKNVIEQLNILCLEGIYVKTDIFEGIIKFCVGAITGDNLGLNSILGYVESFSANHPCRICTANRDQIQNMCEEDKSLLRNDTNYEHMLEMNNTFQTGIKEKCVWQKLEKFNLFNNVAVDLLHDMLEGCCKYVMSFVITYFCRDMKLIHTNTLQQRIASFDFGPDSNSKPTATAVTFEGSSIKLKMSGSEMLTFVRYFSLLIGYYVPRENEVWNLYILLRIILERLLSRRVYSDTCEQLRCLIREFNELYLKLSGESLKPKFHFLLHYPSMLEKFGPLVQIWTMRFEAKHRIGKKIAQSCASRVNICKSIAIKHQLELNDFLIRNEKNIHLKLGKKTKLSISKRQQLRINFRLNDVNSILFSVNFVKIDGVVIKTSQIVTLDISEDTFLPLFAVVNEMFVDSKNCILISCTPMETVYYDEHYVAYKVTTTNTEPLFIAYNNLLAPVPNAINVMPDLSTYVTVRWPLD